MKQSMCCSNVVFRIYQVITGLGLVALTLLFAVQVLQRISAYHPREEEEEILL